MFAGYEGYIAIAITLVCTYLGYWHGKRSGVEQALDGMVSLGMLRVLNNGEIVAGPKLQKK